MAKIKAPVVDLPLPVVEITSLKDGAYKQARSSDVTISVARYVAEQCPTFCEKSGIPDEVRSQLVEGYRLRYNETHPPVEYAVINDHYILATDDHANCERVRIGVDYAFSFSQQKFGQLKKENPYLYPIIKKERDDVSTYCSNRISDLKVQIKRLQTPTGSKTRGATADFSERVPTVLDDLKDKCKTAHKRGDTTADGKKLKLATDAFMTVWNA